MSVKLENKEDPERPVSIKEKCVSCIKGPNLLKTLVVLVCTAIAVQQITTCVMKLINPPITTYTHFDFNKTIMYPSVTFCREPAYRFDKLQEYGLFGHPLFTSEWVNFNFSVPLDQVWREITYEASDYFVQYGLFHEPENLVIHETVGFVYGRCYTLTPTIPMKIATLESGMSITLHHSSKETTKSISTRPPGYHTYVHYTREPFTEVTVYNGGLVDYLFLGIGETIDVKLSVDKYIMISEESEPCNDDDDYSANNCTTTTVWNEVTYRTGCSGPWMRTDYPYCDTYEDMRNLIVTYMELHRDHQTMNCPRFCTSYLYNAYVNDRHRYAWDSMSHEWALRSDDATLQTQLFIHFNSMMVSVYEERHNYDWNLFVSDLGGSVGFLLGLSVIGLMTIFEKFWSTILRPQIKAPNNKKDGQKKDPEEVYKNKDYIEISKLDMKIYFQVPIPRIIEEKYF